MNRQSSSDRLDQRNKRIEHKLEHSRRVRINTSAVGLAATVALVLTFLVTAPLFSASTATRTSAPAPGTILARSRAQLTNTTTQTFTLTAQVFTGSTDCSSGGGAETTVTGVNTTTGYALNLGSGDSVLFTSAPLSEQSNETLPVPSIDLSGRFVSWTIPIGQPNVGITYPPTPDGRKVCVEGFEGPGTREVAASFVPTLQLYDATCTNQLTGLNPVFTPGQTICIKVLGGLTDSAIPLRYFVAGGSVNECTFLPGAGQSLNDFPITSDPQTFSFTLPASDAAIPSYCSSSPTTSLLGSWRTGVVGVSAEIRAVKRFVVEAGDPVPGTIKAKARAQLTNTTTQTFTLTKQVFTGSTDCSTGGGAETTVTGVDTTTGSSLTLGPTDSVLFTAAPLSEQSNETLPTPSIDLSGRFISWYVPNGQPTTGITSPLTDNPDGRKICVAGYQGPGTREVGAAYAPTIQLYDSTCTTQRTGLNPVFTPGETMCIKVLGGLTDNANPLKMLTAGGSVNECTFMPGPGQTLNDFAITTDPQSFSFTLPASNADIPSYCSSSPTTSIIGSWRTVLFDQSASGNRAQKVFRVEPDDTDDDNDGQSDADEIACGSNPRSAASKSIDTDGDNSPDCVDTDDDNDGAPDASDAFPLDPTESVDTDGDGTGDNADADDDADGATDASDNCPLTPNASQLDTDGDGAGNACDADDDGDGISDTAETAAGSDPLNAASLPEVCDGVDNDLNEGVDEGFTNTDGDGQADCVDADDDNDGQSDADEVACGSDPLSNSSKATDTDGDGSPNCVDADDDGDGVADGADNCPLTSNASQADTDGDGTGDACDPLTYSFSGFFQPVDNPPTVNVDSAGSATTVKFSLGGNRGLNIFLAGWPKSQGMVCGGSLIAGDIESTVSPGNNGLKYDSSSDTYSYKWKTDKDWKGTCRQLILKLSDGSTHVANFRFK